MRVFLDANILFSAAKSDGAIRELLRRVVDDGHECWVDEYVLIEARRNLDIKGAAALEVFDDLLTHFRVCPVQPPVSPRPELDWLQEKDRPVLAAAVRAKCDALVTGDRTHFGAGYGKTFGGVTIYSPQGLAEAFFGKR